MRDAAINLRALPEQRELIDQAAKVLGKNRSDFMLEAACERAQSVMLDQLHFALDQSKFSDFVALLDAQPQHNATSKSLQTLQHCQSSVFNPYPPFPSSEEGQPKKQTTITVMHMRIKTAR